jgi:GNAT superfamily N-acetyltransferase
MAFDSSLYEAQRRALSGQYAQQAALNAYQRYLAETRGRRPILQFQEAAFGTTPTGGLGEVPKLTSSYARRGLQGQGVRSGVYNQALSSYAKDRARRMGYAQEDLAGAMRGYDISGQGFQADYERGLADLESSKARQIAADAQALLQYR